MSDKKRSPLEPYPYEVEKVRGSIRAKRDRDFDHASDFLYHNPELGGMPDQQWLIGIDFEAGGAYEDWGYVVYRKKYDPEINKYIVIEFSAGRNLETAIYKARKKMREEFEKSANEEDLCYKCRKNRMAMHQTVDGESKPLCMNCFSKIGIKK